MENMINDFELHDFIATANFDQLVDLIRGESEEPVANFGCDYLINGCLVNSQQFIAPNPQANNNVFEGFDDHAMVSSVPNSLFVDTTLPDFDGEIVMINGGEENDGEDSSGTATTTTPPKGPKVDRSRTLVSERRRRSRMKEKLYALRSLVPNITKMDKASIVGDAVLYVQELQTQAKKLKSEIESLEASLEEAERYEGSTDYTNKAKKAAKARDSQVSMTIIQMDMFQVEERGFYVKVVCNNGEGAAVSLYKALESLSSFNIRSSNLASVSETFVLTFTLNVKECEQEPINLPNLKLWVTGAFLNQGFQLN